MWALQQWSTSLLSPRTEQLELLLILRPQQRRANTGCPLFTARILGCQPTGLRRVGQEKLSSQASKCLDKP
jgi:hypothetical protein